MTALHRFRNNPTAIRYGDPAWDEALEHGLIDIKVKQGPDDFLIDENGHRFVNLCSCAYLGLNRHPAIVQGAIDALLRERLIDLPIARVRICLEILEELEADLSELFGAHVLTAVTASAASAGVLPLIASGHFFGDEGPRVMVFDKLCHFSMNLIKPICGDETEVLTAPHNDLNFVEDLCRKHPRVAYVADATYSMGGAAPIRELLTLQERYGLALYLDDSHSLSVIGSRGEGLARSSMPAVHPLTVIVASLCKGFGTSGGVLMLGSDRPIQQIHRWAGPMAWSQGISVPSIGAALASARIHRTPELTALQQKLHSNVALFDSEIETQERGNGLPLKLVPIGEEAKAVQRSKDMYRRGFYSSAVFFPIVAKNNAGLRVMIRADNRPEDLKGFAAAVRDAMAG